MHVSGPFVTVQYWHFRGRQLSDLIGPFSCSSDYVRRKLLKWKKHSVTKGMERMLGSKVANIPSSL